MLSPQLVPSISKKNPPMRPTGESLSSFFGAALSRHPSQPCFNVHPMATTPLICLHASVNVLSIRSALFCPPPSLWIPACPMMPFPLTSSKNPPLSLPCPVLAAYALRLPLFLLLPRGRSMLLGCLLGPAVFFSMSNFTFILSSVSNSSSSPTSFSLLLMGGGCPFRGSYGCLIATHDLILVSAGGRAHGANPRSFRLEAYGMLTALLLLSNLYSYFQLHISLTTVSHYTYSESLIKRLTASHTLDYPYPRLHLYSKAALNFRF
jgi:hypothetical protein